MRGFGVLRAQSPTTQRRLKSEGERRAPRENARSRGAEDWAALQQAPLKMRASLACNARHDIRRLPITARHLPDVPFASVVPTDAGGKSMDDERGDRILRVLL